MYFFFIAQEAEVEPEIKFNPFTGTGRRLDGKQMKDRQPLIPSSTMAVPAGTKDSTASTSASSSQQQGGKLVFGSRATPADKQKVTIFSVLLDLRFCIYIFL